MLSLSPSTARCLLPAIFIAMVLGACGNEPTVPVPENPRSVATVPMQLDGSRVSVEVTINGSRARMLLDTGADQMALTSAAAKRLGLPIRSTGAPGSGAGGTYSASATTIADLGLGDIHRGKLIAYIVPFPEEFDYDGVIGTPFFAELVLTLDYQQHLVTLRSGVAPLDGAQLPIKLESGKLLVLASAAGVTGWFSVDTGAGNALTFFTPAVKQYSLGNAFSPAVHLITGVSPGGYVRGTLVRVPDVTIGPYVLEQAVVELSEAEQGLFASSLWAGNLGGELLRRFKVTLDYSGRQMSLTPNDAIGDPFVGPRSGLVPSLRNHAIQVIDVVDGSPAAEAGIQIGDVIVSMDGVSTDSLEGRATSSSLDRIIQTLRAAPGTQVRLTVRNVSGAERNVTLELRDLL